jgi:hypothetical protein
VPGRLGARLRIWALKQEATFQSPGPHPLRREVGVIFVVWEVGWRKYGAAIIMERAHEMICNVLTYRTMKTYRKAKLKISTRPVSSET